MYNSLCPFIHFVFVYCSFTFGEALSLAFICYLVYPCAVLHLDRERKKIKKQLIGWLEPDLSRYLSLILYYSSDYYITHKFATRVVQPIAISAEWQCIRKEVGGRITWTWKLHCCFASMSDSVGTHLFSSGRDDGREESEDLPTKRRWLQERKRTGFKSLVSVYMY